MLVKWYIKDVRKKKNLTQKQLSELLGMSLQQLSNIEREQCKLPVKYYDKLAKVAGLNVRVLVNMAVEDYRTEIEKQVKLRSRQ